MAPNPFWYSGFESEVVIAFTDMNEDHFSKYPEREVRLVRRIEEYGELCIQDGLRARLDVRVVDIYFPTTAGEGSASVLDRNLAYCSYHRSLFEKAAFGCRCISVDQFPRIERMSLAVMVNTGEHES